MCRYAVITPARNESANIGRLAEALASQTIPPTRWTIVDDGSTDNTARAALEWSRRWPWIRVEGDDGGLETVRGGQIVRAFNRGVASLDLVPDVVVKLDADVSFGPNYFERLLEAFAEDPTLGIASGSAYELEGGAWVQRHMTGSHVWGASRAYRWSCLQHVLPLDEHMGWDGLDVLRANMYGWNTRTLTDLPFHHHRREGERDGARRLAWAAQGRASHYMGYRFSYLVARAVRHVRREPAAIALISGYLGATARRHPRCADEDVRAYLRRQQRIRHLPLRALESRGRRAAQTG